MHWLLDEGGAAAVVQFALDPIQLLLLGQPFCRQRIRSKAVTTAVKQADHRQGVIALPRLDAKPRPNTVQEWPRNTGRAPPGPAWLPRPRRGRYRLDRTAPYGSHPFEHAAISIRNDDMHPVLISTARGRKRSDDRDASFAVDEAGRVGPVGVRSEEHTSELQSPCNLVCRLLLEKKKHNQLQ